MKKTLRKLLSLLLCVVFVVGILPMTAGAQTITQYSKGDVIEFGWYPQTKETDSRILAHLNAAAPAWESWTSYGYYSGSGNSHDGQMKPDDFMRYTDIVVDGVKYRGVKFTGYRLGWTGDKVSESSWGSYQDTNGYEIGTAYWFRYEPLRWRVLDPAAGLVLCDTIIDSQAFHNYVLSAGAEGFWGDPEKTYYPSNYAKSSIRRWLNNDFCNTAFTAEQQAIIPLTAVDNTAADPIYSSETTNDKIFLLSRSDVLNTEYGFADSQDKRDAARRSESSDYAKCQGLNVFHNDDGDFSYWRMRTALSTFYAYNANADGCVSVYFSTNATWSGIRPAFKLDLTAEILQPSVEIGSAPVHRMTSAVTAPTCTEKGYTTHSCQDCPYTYNDSEVDALGHDADSEPIKEATCIEQAVCSVCGESYGELNPDNHAGTAQWTTTENTHQKHWNCCNATIVETEAHKWDRGVCTDCDYICAHTGGEATCTEQAVCEICGLPYGEALQHDYTAWTAVTLEDKTSVEHTHTCTRCGDTQTAPHRFTDWEHKTKSTFFEDGEDERTCTVCKHTEYRLVYSTLHRILYWLEGFGIFLVAVALSPFFWIIKTSSPALYQKLVHALTGK